MPDRSPELNAAVRAVRGESDLDAVLPALGNGRLAQVIACAPDAHPLVGAVAALCGRLPSVLDPLTVADPAFSDALVRLIGMPAGRAALWWWAEIAPADWGRTHAAALRDAAHSGMCAPGAAAALIGPGDASADLLADAWDIAFAIRCWGTSVPNDTTVPAERQRLLDAAPSSPFARVLCLPWLPMEIAYALVMTVDDISTAIHAFDPASSPEHARGTALLRQLVAHTHSAHLGTLTRLASSVRRRGMPWRMTCSTPS